MKGRSCTSTSNAVCTCREGYVLVGDDGDEKGEYELRMRRFRLTAPSWTKAGKHYVAGLLCRGTLPRKESEMRTN